MFDAKIWLIRYGNGRDLECPRDRQGDRGQQDDRRHVVEDRREQRRRDREHHEQPERLAARTVDGESGDVLEEAGLTESAGQDHHPGQQEDDVEVDPGERLLLVDDAEDDDQQSAQQGDQGPVEALGGDQGVGDDEDAAGEQDVHVRTTDGRARARLDHSGCRSREDVGKWLGRTYPPGPSLAATTSDVCPRATFIFSRASMTREA